MAVACSSDDSQKAVLTQEEMVNILIDIHLAEAGVQDMRLVPDSAAKIYSAEEKLIFKKHHVTDSNFIRSYNFYIEHSDQMEEIYSAVIDSLSLRQVLLRESESK